MFTDTLAAAKNKSLSERVGNISGSIILAGR